MGTESNNDQIPKWVKSLFSWLPKFGASYFTVFIGGLLAYGTLYALFSWSVNRYLDERDETLNRIDQAVRDYKSGTDERLQSILTDVRRTADSVNSVESDISDIRERIATLEAQSTLMTQTLAGVQAPGQDLEYVPLLAYEPEPFMGGGIQQEAQGFDKMVSSIPVPRTVQERNRAISDLTAQHRRSIDAIGRPEFNPEIHDFEVAVSQFVSPDGEIRLQIVSRVVLSGVPEPGFPE